MKTKPERKIKSNLALDTFNNILVRGYIKQGFHKISEER